jgi:hypothetical protein
MRGPAGRRREALLTFKGPFTAERYSQVIAGQESQRSSCHHHRGVDGSGSDSPRSGQAGALVRDQAASKAGDSPLCRPAGLEAAGHRGPAALRIQPIAEYLMRWILILCSGAGGVPAHGHRRRGCGP